MAGSVNDKGTYHQLHGRGDFKTLGLLASLLISIPGVRPVTDFLSRSPMITHLVGEPDPRHEIEKTRLVLRMGVGTWLWETVS